MGSQSAPVRVANTITHTRNFLQPELQLVETLVNVRFQGEDVFEAMHLCAVEFFDRIDSTETIQYSVHGRRVGLLQEGYTITVNNGDHVGDMLRAHLRGRRDFHLSMNRRCGHIASILLVLRRTRPALHL